MFWDCFPPPPGRGYRAYPRCNSGPQRPGTVLALGVGQTALFRAEHEVGIGRFPIALCAASGKDANQERKKQCTRNVPFSCSLYTHIYCPFLKEILFMWFCLHFHFITSYQKTKPFFFPFAQSMAAQGNFLCHPGFSWAKIPPTGKNRAHLRAPCWVILRFFLPRAFLQFYARSPEE